MKKKRMWKILAVITVAVMMVTALASCGGGGSSDNGGGGSSDASEAPQVADTTELNYLFSSDTTDWNYLVETSNTPAETIDSLVEYDNYGICQPCLAESWERSEDGLTWTFHIRKGVKWMKYDLTEYGEDVTANDFVTSCRYILDPANGSQLVDMMFTIAGAEDYYTAKTEGQDVSFDDMVGCKALDDYTLQYTLESAIPYFLSSVTYKNFFPANQDWIDECGDQFSTDHETMLYCGEFIMTEYVPQQKIEYVANPTYWDAEDMHITAMHKTYNAEADTVAPEMYLRGEINYAEIPTEQIDEWINDPERYNLIRPSRPGFYTYYYHFCFNPCFDEKYEPDNWLIAVNNINFRKSIMYAMDKLALTEVSDPYTAEDHVQNTLTPSEFISSEGVDYTQLEPLKDWTESTTYNTDTATEYKEKAMQEIVDAGGHLPVIIFVPYDVADTADTQRVQVLEQMLERNLGTDYIDIQTEGYPDDGYSQATNRSCNFAMMRGTWLADYQDPKAYTDPFRIYQNRGCCIYAADGMGVKHETQVEGSIEAPYLDRDGKTWYYTDLVLEGMTDEADAEVVDLTSRYNKLAEVERWVIDDQCLVIPYMRSGIGFIASSLNPFESQYAPFGASDGRYKYQYIYTRSLNPDEFEVAYEEWKEERSRRLQELADEGKVFGVDY